MKLQRHLFLKSSGAAQIRKEQLRPCNWTWISCMFHVFFPAGAQHFTALRACTTNHFQPLPTKLVFTYFDRGSICIMFYLCSRYYDVSCASSVYDMRVPCTWLIYTSILGDFHSSHRPWPLFAITGTKHYILLETWCCLVIYNTAKTGPGEPFFWRPPITRRWDGMGLHRCTQKDTSSDVFNIFTCANQKGERPTQFRSNLIESF